MAQAAIAVKFAPTRAGSEGGASLSSLITVCDKCDTYSDLAGSGYGRVCGFDGGVPSRFHHGVAAAAPFRSVVGCQNRRTGLRRGGRRSGRPIGGTGTQAANGSPTGTQALVRPDRYDGAVHPAEAKPARRYRRPGAASSSISSRRLVRGVHLLPERVCPSQ